MSLPIRMTGGLGPYGPDRRRRSGRAGRPRQKARLVMDGGATGDLRQRQDGGVCPGCKGSHSLGDKSAVDLFWAGAALWLIRDKLKKEEPRWVAWQQANKLARSTVLEAIALYENAMSPDALVGLGITEAKERFGVVKPKLQRPQPRHRPRSHQEGRLYQLRRLRGGSPQHPLQHRSRNLRNQQVPRSGCENQIQPVADQLENWTLNDMGRLLIPNEQRTTWQNIAASLRATAKRIEDYLGKPVGQEVG